MKVALRVKPLKVSSIMNILEQKNKKYKTEIPTDE